MRELTLMLVYIGTYTGNGSKGIYVSQLDLKTGALQAPEHVAEMKNPTFLAIAPDCRHLYAVSEIGRLHDRPTGGLSAYAIDPKTGALTFLNQQESKGQGPCQVAVHPNGKAALVANYGSGSVALLPIGEDGSLGPATDFVQHEGSGANPKRQQGPHAHSFTISPDGRFAYACDLGVDRIFTYELDLDNGKLRPAAPPFTKVHAGAGPRHFAFHPSAPYAYVINELDSTLTVFDFNGQTGALTEKQTVTTLPADFEGNNTTADIHIHPSGRFLYGSNRGHDSLAIFEIDESTGKLTLIGHESTRGRAPRNFALDPTGRWLLAANQNSNNIVVFAIDEQTGKLTPTGQEIEVSKPVCLKLMPFLP